MKIMKENRDSMHLKSQENNGDSENMNQNIPSSNSMRRSVIEWLSSAQRTKDEDWKNIFSLYQKYIELLVNKSNITN